MRTVQIGICAAGNFKAIVKHTEVATDPTGNSYGFSLKFHVVKHGQRTKVRHCFVNVSAWTCHAGILLLSLSLSLSRNNEVMASCTTRPRKQQSRWLQQHPFRSAFTKKRLGLQAIEKVDGMMIGEKTVQAVFDR